MKKIFKKAMLIAACGGAALVSANPATAAVWRYTMTNGDVLRIDTETQKGWLIGTNIEAYFNTPEFANFQGGATPTGSYTLAQLGGYRIINGVKQFQNPSHTQVLKFLTGNRVNLWSVWGNPGVGGDYITTISSSSTSTSTGGTAVPAPGVLGLFGLGLAGIGFARRRKSVKPNTVTAKIAFA